MTTTKRVHDVPVPEWAHLGAPVAVAHKTIEKMYAAQVVKITASTVQVIVNNPDGDMKFPEYIAFSRSSQKRNGSGSLSPRGWRTHTSGWIAETLLLPASAPQEVQEDQQGPEPEDYGALFEASPIMPPKNENLKSAAKAAQEEPAPETFIELEPDRDATINGITYEIETILAMDDQLETVDQLLACRNEIRAHLTVRARNAAEDYLTALPSYQKEYLDELNKYRNAVQAINKLANERIHHNAQIPF